MDNKTSPGKLIAKYVVILAAAAVSLFPVYWVVGMAFKQQNEWAPTTGVIYWLPTTWTTDNFMGVFGNFVKSQGMTGYAHSSVPAMFNSLIAAGGGTILALIVGTLAAYAMSRWKSGGGNLAFSILQLRMFPPAAIIIPLMIMWSALKLTDNLIGLILIYGVITMPFIVWLMKSFFDEIPREMDEAAICDGCSNARAFFTVVLPLVKGGLATAALFVFILNWSDFLVAFILTSKNAVTIPVELSKMVSGIAGQQYGPKAALGLIAAIPPIIFGLAIQKYLVRGLTFGAIKK
jgi:multiple sugar transport system permease protein